MRVYNEAAVKDAVLECVLERYADIPAEEEINYTFSQKFERWAKGIIEKTKEYRFEAPLRFSKKAIKTIALVAALIALLATTAMAVPAIREAIIDFFLHDRGESYGVTFNPEKAATAPDIIQTYWIPTAIPEGYSIMFDEKAEAGVVMWWCNEADEWICYNQRIVAKNTTDTNWFGTNSENVTHKTMVIEGYKIEMTQDDEIYTVFWTDNSYFYWIEFSNTIDFSVFEAMLASMTPVEER